MANAEHLKILKEGVEAWHEWRENRSLLSPDLSGADLSAAKLKGANLRGANLSGNNLSGADLSGASLSGAVLSYANLIVANLGGASLSSAHLPRANLSHANLARANLRGANLNGANLSGADLTGADLSGADLSHANLNGANLSGANLSSVNLSGAKVDNAAFNGAYFQETTFALNSLKTAKGLDSCQHGGRSALDYHTLLESGPLPERFLRGCGLSNEFIQSVPAFWNPPAQFHCCFISHSHADKSFALRLHDALQDRDIRCWLDEKPIQPGDLARRGPDEAVRRWDKVLLCCSATSLHSWWIDKEIQKTLLKEEQFRKERGKELLAIIPISLDDSLSDPKWEDWKKEPLTRRMAADFTGWKNINDKFNTQLENLINALRAGAGELPSVPPV